MLSSPARADIVLSENFDELSPKLDATSVGAFSAISATNVDILGGSLYGALCVSPLSGDCIDLGGSGGNPEGILQTNALTLDPGTAYYLSFDLIGSQRSNSTSTTVTFGSYSQTFNLASGDITSGIVTDQLVTVGSLTKAFLAFTNNTPGNSGALLDNVLITSSPVDPPAAVPEPSSIMPALLPLLVLALTKLRRAHWA